MEENKKYFIFADVLRIMACAAIVMIHVTSNILEIKEKVSSEQWLISVVLNAGSRWGTLVFIMVSGYLLLNSSKIGDVKLFFKKRADKIVIPLVFWSVFYYLVKVKVLSGSLSLGDFFGDIWKGGPYYHLYFLYLISGLYMVSPWVNKLINSIKFNSLVKIWLISLFISAIYGYVITFWLWPQLNQAVTWFIPYIGIYIGGYVLGRLKIKSHLWYLPLIGLFLIINILGTNNLAQKFSNTDMGWYFLYRLNPLNIAIAIIIFIFLKNLESLDNIKIGKDRIKTMGSLTMGVYLIHPMIIELFKRADVMKGLMLYNAFSWVAITFFSTFVLSLILTLMIKKIKVANRII